MSDFSAVAATKPSGQFSWALQATKSSEHIIQLLRVSQQ